MTCSQLVMNRRTRCICETSKRRCVAMLLLSLSVVLESIATGGSWDSSSKAKISRMDSKLANAHAKLVVVTFTMPVQYTLTKQCTLALETRSSHAR